MKLVAQLEDLLYHVTAGPEKRGTSALSLAYFG